VETVQELLLRYSSCTFAPRTVNCYGKDWAHFVRWCEQERRVPLPAASETVLLYLTGRLQDGRKITTVRQYLSAINSEHRSHGFPAPAAAETRQLFSGAQRILCQQPSQKRPLSVDHARQICAGYGTASADVRDRAILTLGLASALRQSSIVDLDLADVEFVAQGMILRIRREKTDQKAKGRHIGVVLGHPPTCPVANLKAWLAVRGDDPGPLFTRFGHRQGSGKLSYERLWPKKVSQIVKAGVKSIGLDPRKYGGHSLRAGLVTAALESGCSQLVVAAQSGHKSLSSLQKYFRRADVFRANCSGMIGL
jgi:integrase